MRNKKRVLAYDKGLTKAEIQAELDQIAKAFQKLTPEQQSTMMKFAKRLGGKN